MPTHTWFPDYDIQYAVIVNTIQSSFLRKDRVASYRDSITTEPYFLYLCMSECERQTIVWYSWRWEVIGFLSLHVHFTRDWFRKDFFFDGMRENANFINFNTMLTGEMGSVIIISLFPFNPCQKSLCLCKYTYFPHAISCKKLFSYSISCQSQTLIGLFPWSAFIIWFFSFFFISVCEFCISIVFNDKKSERCM